MNTGIWGWDLANYLWRKVLVDAAGHLQVDVITAGGTASHCMGFDGGGWNPLLVESVANANLRVRLYDGADGLDSSLLAGGAVAITDRALLTIASLYAWDGTIERTLRCISPADNLANPARGLHVLSHLMGFNGATWDRLRVDAAYNLQVDVNEVRKTDTSTIAQVAVGVASTAVLAANAARIFAEFVNDSANVIYLALGAAAVMNRGIRLNANGGSFEIGLTNLYTGVVTAISGVAAQNLTVSEG